MSVYLPNPCLLGILFTITTHNGPQLVFHYPPRPKSYDYQARPSQVDEDLVDSDSSSEETDASSEAEESEDESNRKKTTGSKYVSGQTLLDLLDEEDRKNEAKHREMLGFIHKKKGSVSSNPYGSSYSKSLDNGEHLIHSLANDTHKVFDFDHDFLSELLNAPKQLCNTKFELTVDDMTFVGLPIHINDDGFWRAQRRKRDTKSKHSTNTNNSVKSEQLDEGNDHTEQSNEEYPDISEENESMTMFHVVFVMNPPLVEYDYRVDEMFSFVISRFSLVLRHEQAKSNYVWEESKKILKLREEYLNSPIYEFYKKVTEESTLANAIANCYNAISTSNIANLQIGNKLVSLQIPIKNQFKSLLPKTVPVLSGSFLSSLVIDDEDPDLDTKERMGYMALLLLDDPENIITELKTDSYSPLGIFLKNIHPMMSLNKLAMINQLDPGQLVSFARHLIYWRKARAIIPLHAKHVFIVSPMAPLDNIEADTRGFRYDFPSLPSLPSFLALLSTSKPRQYTAIIPSKDHREIYMDALAWLVRYGYVTQLLTFVWLKVPNRIKIAIEEDLEREGLTKKSSTKSTAADAITTDATSKGVATGDTNGSSTSLRYILNGEEVELIEEDEEDTILLEPERATAVERRWISKIIKGQPPEVISVFHKLLKHFNGTSPLELVIVQENVSRQELKKLLHSISENIISVKHW